MVANKLFRNEVLQEQQARRLGVINLATPLSLRWWAVLAFALGAAVVLFLVFGHYTRRETVSGQLLPSAGILTVTSQTTGTVVHALVHEGEHVRAGQLLVKVSANLHSADMGSTHAVVSKNLRAQQKQVRATLSNIRSRAAAQKQGLKKHIALLSAQVGKIDNQLALQKKQAATAVRLFRKAGPLHRQGALSTVQLDQYQASALSQKARVKTLERQSLDAQQKLSQLRTQLRQLPWETASHVNQLQGQLAELDAQLAKSEALRSTVLRAPLAGTVSTMLVKAGQHVASGQTLLSILPDGSDLQAQLLVPSKAIGFVSPGNRVVLRYQAYPYQKFGQQYGKVEQVSRSPLSTAAVAALLGRNVATPLYRVRVALDRQSIDAYGKARPLKPGMTLEASIMLDRRSLLQWAFEPLYGLQQEVAAGGERQP